MTDFGLRLPNHCVEPSLNFTAVQKVSTQFHFPSPSFWVRHVPKSDSTPQPCPLPSFSLTDTSLKSPCKLNRYSHMHIQFSLLQLPTCVVIGNLAFLFFFLTKHYIFVCLCQQIRTDFTVPNSSDGALGGFFKSGNPDPFPLLSPPWKCLSVKLEIHYTQI